MSHDGPVPWAIRILIAEDASTVRHALASLVESEPAMELVAVAEDAVQAIDLARSSRPDVALIDVKMPGGGGVRATREIRRDSPGTRVVALSAHQDGQAILDMIDAGADTYLVKGTPAEEILAAIRAAAVLPVLDLTADPPTVELPP